VKEGIDNPSNRTAFITKLSINVILFLGISLTVCVDRATAQVKACFPVITSVSYEAPSPGAHLQRGAIVYVKGNTLDVSLVIPSCASVSDVTAEGLPRDDVAGSGEGSVPWSLISDTPSGTDQHVVTVRLTMVNVGNGRSHRVMVNVGGLRTRVTHTFTWVGVLDVAIPSREYSVSENEIFNHFIANAYASSSGDVETKYGKFRVDVQPDGIHFRAEYTKPIQNYCDMNISVTGVLRLLPSPSGADVAWVSGPDADLDMPLWCELPARLNLAYWIVKAIATTDAEESVRESIETGVNGLFPGCGEIPCNLIIETIETRNDDVVIRFRPELFPTGVTVEVPYQNYDPVQTWALGLALNPSEVVLATASGTVDVCQDGGRARIGTCRSYRLGPAGLFNWKTNPPVPSPWYLTEYGWAYYADRAAARAVLRGADREPTILPKPGLNVGALIVRSSASPRVLRIDAPCAIETAASGETRLLFSNNDLVSNNYGSGHLLVSVLWPADMESVRNSACVE
jgi:hypothetical protein